MKDEICERVGIHLFVVPFWWDKKKESLHSTIYLSRPDIISPPPPFSIPIPNENPNASKISQGIYIIYNIGISFFC